MRLSSHDGGGGWPGGAGGVPPGCAGAPSVFGNGVPFGGISGAAAYDSNTGTWTVTGAATVDIRGETGAAVLRCKRLVVDGGALTVPTNCKGLLVFASVSVECVNGGKIHIDKLGKAGNFGNLTPLDLIPVGWFSGLNRARLSAHVVLGEGAAGAAGVPGSPTGNVSGHTGGAASAMQTGGGGSGARSNNSTVITVGAGGKGGPCCGGAASGGAAGTVGQAYSSAAAGAYGADGSDGHTNEGAGYATGGGAGDPKGRTYYADTVEDTTNVPTGAGGGLLMLFAPALSIASGCIVSADGGVGGGASGGTGGGSAGGGCVALVTKAGGYTNAGTVRASGGAAKACTYGSGGAGGAGSVNILAV
jgi:hypothetical protein